MYKEFYGLTEEPFTLRPDPKFLYLSKSHAEGLNFLLQSLERKKGFSILTGGVGFGKTILLNLLRLRLGREYHMALLPDAQPTSIGILQSICHEFNLNIREKNQEDLSLVLHDFIRECAHAKENCLLILDEAQSASPDVLEQLRLLSNFETHQGRHVQILLVGHPDLHDRLNAHDGRKVKQRIEASFALAAMEAQETASYIAHRLQIAGATHAPFTLAAIADIHRCTGGVPRLINLVCDAALTIGVQEQQRDIGPLGIRRAMAQVGGALARRGHTVGRDQDGRPDAAETTGGAAPEHGHGAPNLWASPALPQGQWRLKPVGRRGAWRVSWHALGMGMAVGLVVGLLLGSGLARLGGSRREPAAALTDAALSLASPAMPRPNRRVAGPVSDPSPALSPPTRFAPEAETPAPGTTQAIADDSLVGPPRRAESGPEASDRMPPAPAAAPPETPAKHYVRNTVVVRAGDTLETIVRQEYGQFQQDLLSRVLAINPNILDPDVLEPNQLILLPKL